ncbi:DUF1882 domain-containing protein, partial [Campylobacter coli]|nr:DUF1882 domain-containing protein [Campylobacter coli]EHV4789494.1 DUF1882 domain-containing protein [Campylobacter coli]
MDLSLIKIISDHYYIR